MQDFIDKRNQFVQPELTDNQTSTQTSKIGISAGDINLIINSISINFFGYNFHDPSWIRINIAKINHGFSAFSENAIQIHRRLNFVVNDLDIMKMTEKSNQKLQFQENSRIADRHVNAMLTRIFHIPNVTVIVMNTLQNVGSNLVEYEFITNFDSPIEVRLYSFVNHKNFIADIISMFKKQTQLAMGDKVAANKKEIISPDRKLQRLKDGPFILEPRLQILGEATPSVETLMSILKRMGINSKIDVIPDYTNQLLMDSSETVLHILHALFETNN